MKLYLWAMLPLMMARSALAQHAYTEAGVIAYAKAIDAQTLDSELSSQRLEDWLQNGPPHATIRWDVADTCDNKPYRNAEYPLCAKVWFVRDGEAGSFLIKIGTNHKGIQGRPELYNSILSWEDGPGWIMTGDAVRLSGLTALLDQPAYSHNVGLLYAAIVNRGLIGVPSGATLANIRPFLSKRLIELFESAADCQADYLGQSSSNTAGSTEPSWLKADPFSGTGSRALPASAWPVRQGQQKDGSFLVLVNLFARTISVGNGLKGGLNSSGGTWQVQVKVVPENGQFVVDDVRLFDGSDIEGPSHLLTDSFVGCASSHWTGDANQTHS